MTTGPYPQIVFSGGGLRCFWQGGFMNVVRDPLGLDPARITGVSGGGLGSAAFIAHRGHKLLRTMQAAFAENPGNVEWHEPREVTGLTPHQEIYREVAEEVLDAEAIEAIANGPAYQVLIGHPPGDGRLSGTAATLAYEAELHLINAPHFNWAEKVGVTSTLVDARAAARDGRLIDLVVAAATIPPIFTPPEWDGKPVIDGGMADQAPMPEPDEGPTLILLTRRYRNIPEIAGRHYIWPSEAVPVDKIDFTDPDALQKAWDAGEEDGRDFLKDNQNHTEEET